MQLKRFRNVSGLLSAAACSLIGANTNALENEGTWNFESALLFYSEPDRVSAAEGAFQALRNFGDDHIFSGKVVVDALTGASANGALPQNDVQTFTRPSGEGRFDVVPGETPLDDTFHDTRVQVNAQWTQPLWQESTVSSGLHFSKEYDYTSVALNGSLARDFNRNNTTVSLGFSYAFDAIDPEGGRPIPFAESIVNTGQFATEEDYWAAFDATRLKGGDDTKNTADLVLGITQIMNRSWLMQFNFGISQVDGYLNDPFKLVTLVDSDGNAQAQLYESRPDTRSKNFVYIQSKYHLSNSVLDLSWRFSDDDWGLSANTLEARYRMPLSEISYLQPHVRYYSQTAVDFYHRYLMDTNPLPEYASADYRIGDMTAYTFGFKYGRKLHSGNEFSVRLEYYLQNAEGDNNTGLSALEGLDLYPDVDALMLQFGYSF